MHDVNDILGIKGIKTNDVQVVQDFGEPTKHIVSCELTDSLETCGAENCCRSFHIKETKTSKFKDLPLTGHQTELHLKVPRYRCKMDGSTFSPELSVAASGTKMTTRLLNHVAIAVFGITITDVASEYGLSKSSAYRAFDEVRYLMEREYVQEAPEVLGIDECHFAGEAHAVFTDIRPLAKHHEKSQKKRPGQKNQVIDMHVSRSKDAICETIQSWANIDNIRYVAIDMYRPYRDAVRATIPNAVVVIDKRHVLEYARKAMEEERLKLWRRLKKSKNKALKGSLKRLTRLINKRPFDMPDDDKAWMMENLSNYPNLATAYELKEQFYNMWEASSGEEAREYYRAWENSIPEDIEESFKDTLSIFKNWGDEIFAYFDTPLAITNAYTESANRLIKKVYHQGYGNYRFDNLRARVLHKHGPWTKEMIMITIGEELACGTLLDGDGMIEQALSRHCFE